MDILFFALLLIVAFFYATVGHGGASGYLALMALFAFSPDTMRTTALTLNVFVSAMAFVQFYRKGYFRWSLFWPFALASIPAAFLGGTISVDENLYKKILAILLLVSIIRMVGFTWEPMTNPKKQSLWLSLLIGAIIGLFSGMIGIGGGIILSPVILLLHWADMKQTAAISAIFIFVNSLAGLAGVFQTGLHWDPAMGWMLAIAIVGGTLGSYFGAAHFNSIHLRRLLAFVLLIAAFKLFFT